MNFKMVAWILDRRHFPQLHYLLEKGVAGGWVMAETNNVLGEKLKTCCTAPMTGFYRTGTCETGPQDAGTHVICAQVTKEFLSFTKSRGNDLTTPAPAQGFPGLKPGDRWCLCANRWREAMEAGVAPSVILRATHKAALRVVSLEDLKKHALDLA